jgi:hypothetical protein
LPETGTLSKRLFATIVVVALAAIVALVAFTSETTVHRIPIPGYPDKTVDFVYCRAMNGECGYIVRFGESETKTPFITSDVSVEEVKSNTRVDYQDKTLVVFGPQGQRLEIAGYTP